MIQENELLMMLLGIGTLVLIWTNYSKIRRFEGVHLFVCAFFFMLTGWVLTILESMFLYEFFWPTRRHWTTSVPLLKISLESFYGRPPGFTTTKMHGAG